MKKSTGVPMDADGRRGTHAGMSSPRKKRRAAVAVVACALSSGSLTARTVVAADGPSFDCSKVAAGSIESLICADSRLSALDRQLAGVYAEATKKAVDEHPPVLRAEQRGWIKGRDDCWKNDDRRACVEDEYTRRIAELQARYRLVRSTGPFTFVCDAPAGGEVVVRYFSTVPRTLIAERGDSSSLMYLQPSGSGSRYQGRNESFWEHQAEAIVTWGYGAPEMRCSLKP